MNVQDGEPIKVEIMFLATLPKNQELVKTFKTPNFENIDWLCGTDFTLCYGYYNTGLVDPCDINVKAYLKSGLFEQHRRPALVRAFCEHCNLSETDVIVYMDNDGDLLKTIAKIRETLPTK